MTDTRRFRVGLGAVTAVGFALRLAYIVFERRGFPVGGDAYAYHQGANLLADGHGYIEPFSFDAGVVVQSADHPPLYLTYLAAFSLVGLDGASAHRVASALLGAATVLLVGLIGRRVAGARVGLVGAAVAAVYPNLWSYDGSLLSESMAQCTAALAVLAAYVCWDRPDRRSAVALGAAVALAALSRSELALLVPVLLWPVVAKAPGLVRRDRWRLAAAGTVAAGLVVAPWCAYNLTRFERPVFLSGQLEAGLVVAYCDDTFDGPLLGYWSKRCIDDSLAASGLPATADRSVLATFYGEDATRYLRANLGRLPVVVAARVGRIAGVYRIDQQVIIDQFANGREHWVAEAASLSFRLLGPLAVVGAVVLRRRRRGPLLPLLALPIVTLTAVVLVFADTRFRAAAEPVLAVLAAAALVAGFEWLRPPRDRTAAETGAETPAETPAPLSRTAS